MWHSLSDIAHYNRLPKDAFIKFAKDNRKKYNLDDKNMVSTWDSDALIDAFKKQFKKNENFINEEEQVYSEQHAKELLAIQANYNKKLEQLNTELAKQKSDLMIKHMKLAQQQAAADKLKQKTEVEPEQKSIAKTGNVDTAGNPVTSKGGTPAVESINILRIKELNEEGKSKMQRIYDYVDHCIENHLTIKTRAGITGVPVAIEGGPSTEPYSIVVLKVSSGKKVIVRDYNIILPKAMSEAKDEQVRYGNPGYSPDMRNWYEKPVTGGHKEEKPKEKRKGEMTYKRRMEINDLEYEIRDLKDEIKWAKEKFETPTYEGIEGEIEDFFGEIGHEAADILNSGGYKTDAQKIKALKDVGVKDAEGVLETYYYYYPEFNPALTKERKEAEKKIQKLEKEIVKRQAKIDKMYSMYESLNEATFNTEGVNDDEYLELKNYLDAENISYFEDEDGTEIDFDDTELDAEWQDRLEEIGLEYVRDFEDEEPKTNDILSIEDEEDITDTDEKIDNEKVFYVKVEDEGAAFVGKIYKLFNEGDWRSKIVDGESETFEKINFDPAYDEIDIISFLRENYSDAELLSEDEYNKYIEDSSKQLKESIHRIPSLDEFIGNEKI